MSAARTVLPFPLFLHGMCRYKFTFPFRYQSQRCVGRLAQSVQRLATGWTVRGSNPGWGEIFRTCPDRPWGPPSLLYNGYRVFPGGKEWPGRDADPLPPSSAVVKKGQSYTSTPPVGRMARTDPQCMYKGALQVGTTLIHTYRRTDGHVLNRRFSHRFN